MQKATNKDLTNLLVLLGAKTELSPQLRDILLVLSVSTITQELQDRQRKGKYHVPKRATSDPDIVVDNSPGGAPVHGEGDI